MRSPAVALAWEIWRHNRVWAILTATLLLIGSIIVFTLPHDAHSPVRNTAVSIVFSTMGGFALLLVFGMFHYTELDPRTGSASFPRRLFTLPVSSLRLVAVPILLGVATLMVVHLTMSAWGAEFSVRAATGLAAFMVVYQTILWTCARLRALRSVILGVAAIWFLYVGFGGMRATSDSLEGSQNVFTIGIFLATAAVAFIASWLFVAYERSGGSQRRLPSGSLIDGVSNALPQRARDFRSPSAAQLWMEWRRGGIMLPSCVAAILILLIAPLCWYLRDDADSTMRILVSILAMPLLLSLPVGKGLSKPDFWTKDLGFPPFLAVRPLSSRDFVIIKMKVAALSAAATWLLTFVFLAIWLPLIARLDGVKQVWRSFESLFGGTYYLVAGLLAFSLMLLTWRFLIGGLWIGFSGSRTLFGISAAPYVFTPVFLTFALILLVRRGSPIEWALAHVDRFPPTAVAILAAASVLKFAFAITSIRKIGKAFLIVWVGTTTLLVILALLLSRQVGPLLPSISDQIRNVLVLSALLLVPFARLGLASSLLEKNRHR